MLATHDPVRMIELPRLHAIVRPARELVFIGRAGDFVRRAACRAAGALAIEATALMNARDAAWRRAGVERLARQRSG
jgi:hypothetical protein